MVGQPVEELLGELDSMALRAEAAIDQLEQEKREIDDKIKRLKRFQTVLADRTPAAKKPPGGKPSVGKEALLPPRLIVEVAEFLEAYSADHPSFTAIDVYEAMDPDWTQNRIYTVFSALRGEGFLGKTTRDPETNRDMWVVLDPQRVDRLRERVNGLPA